MTAPRSDVGFPTCFTCFSASRSALLLRLFYSATVKKNCKSFDKDSPFMGKEFASLKSRRWDFREHGA